ncbi:MAG TPA: tRNA epoxyqueuosine(34) reductase QueG [Myxococcales bacterium LLY-WYZ-16_1]|nr:tRNA epoxyqueuosine(34) reductase QueG [Myxococcales bacterium LLY-WYZ-16_1]
MAVPSKSKGQLPEGRSGFRGSERALISTSVAPRQPDAPGVRARTDALRRAAGDLGFDAFGVARVAPIDPEGRLRAWLARGYHGGMDYMAERVAEREDVTRLVPGARSVVVLASSYYRPDYRPHERLAVSRYAAGDDYHRVIRKKIRKLRKILLEWEPGASVKPTIDTSPVLERAWAARAGVAWIGKSTMALSTELGTYFFLSTLITDVELVPDEPVPDRCGSCTRCLDACPTDAFVEPGVLDATRCITYWTVERRDAEPGQMVDLHGWVAGCDVCQEVCPWNKFARPTREPRFAPRAEWSNPVHLNTPKAWARAAEGTALQRTGGPALHRNAEKIRADPGPSGPAVPAGQPTDEPAGSPVPKSDRAEIRTCPKGGFRGDGSAES